MSDTDATTGATSPHDDHEDGHGDGEAVAPIGAPDLRAWGAAIGGGAIGVLVVIAMYVAMQV